MAALDALRGLSVLGIVLMNVFTFSMPGAAYFNPTVWGGDGPSEIAAWAVSFVLVEDKFRTLFAMMFGAGVAVLLSRPGPHPLRDHYARMAVLFAIGFLHALLLNSGDVLRLYAIAGLVLPCFARLGIRGLWIWAAGFMALHMIVGGYIAFGWVDYWWHYATVPGVDPAPLAPSQAAFGPDPETTARALEIGRETVSERVERRLSSPLGALIAALAFLPTSLAAMLAGMALWRGGMLAGEWTQARTLRFALPLAAISLPFLAALAWLDWWSGFHGAVVGTTALVWSALFDFLLALAMAAAAMRLFVSREDSGWVSRLAAVGRMALTNYVGTSVILAFVFAGWGMGLFGEVSRLGAYGVSLVPMALMLIVAPLWLARFRQGPIEWLWRGAARGRFGTLRR